MANKETRVLKQDTLEILRQKTNEISLHVGDNEQLDALLADKTYNYTASANQVLFDGADSNSKVARFELSPQHTIDNTGGSIILEGVSSLDSSYVANANIYQGSAGSETWQASIVSATTNKIIVRDSSGTFSSSADLKVGASSPDTIANAKIARIIIESYPVAIARVYNNNTELTQGMVTNGFFAPKIVGVASISNSPTIGDAFSEGVTVYQKTGDALTSQADVEANSNWYGVLHSVDSDEIRFKTSQGSFSATAKLRVLGSSDEIAAANHGALTAVDTTYGSYIELTTPAANTNVIKVFSLDLVAAINELQDDIGTVENLTTSANDVVLAINEHDSELGTITAAAMATTASTVSGAIREHEDQIGNVDITGISGSNNTITGALEQIHNEIGDVTASNLGTSASNLTAAVREHEDQIGSESISSIDSGDTNNTITGALNQLHTEVGSLSLNTSASDLTAAINEHEGDIGNMSLTGLTATDLSAAIRELRVELGNHLEINDATGYSATTAVGGIKEIQGDIGDVDDLDTNTDADLVAAINELENVLRDDTTQRTGYVMDTDANNVVAAINEIEGFLRGTNTNYTLNTAAQNVRDAINEHESQIGNMVFGTGGPVDAADSTDLSGAVRVLDAEIGDTTYAGADLTTAIKDIQDDIYVGTVDGNPNVTQLNTTNKFLVGAINEIDAEIFNSVSSGDRRTLNSLSTADKTSIVDAINEIYADIHTSGSVTLDTEASHLVGAINEIEAVFDASAKNITAGTNTFSITSGAFTINSSANINLDTGNNHIVLKNDDTEFGRLTHNGGQLQLKSGNNQVFLSATNTNAQFNNDLGVDNDLTVTNNLIVNGTDEGVNVDIAGDVDIDGTTNLDDTIIVGNLTLNSTQLSSTFTELNVMDGNTSATSTTIVNGDRVVVNDDGTMVQVTVQDLAAYFDHQITNMPNLASAAVLATVGTLDSGSITSGFGSIDVGTSTIDGGIITGSQFRIGDAHINETELERIDGLTIGSVTASKVVTVDANKDVDGFRNITLSGELDAGSLDISGGVDIDGSLDVALGSTLRGAVSITDNTASSSSATGALTVAGGVGIGEDLYVAGDLYVEGTRTELNVTTLEVEDTLVLAGNNLSSEPTSGGFGLEVGPITSPSGVASGVTGAHSIVYNYATDQWEADGSLILSSATLGTPSIEGTDFGSTQDLSFSAGAGLSEAVTGLSGNNFVVTYTNTDRGSSQNIFKTVAPSSGDNATADTNSDTLNLTQGSGISTVGSGDNIITISNTDRGSSQHIFKNVSAGGVTVSAEINNDTLALTDDDVVNVLGVSDGANGDEIQITHADVLTDNSGSAGSYGQTGTQDGKYIKSLTLTAEGHVSAITTGDFDSRYEASDPSWTLKVNDASVDPVNNGDSVDFRLAEVDSVAGLTIGSSTSSGNSIITLGHANTSSITNLNSDNSGGTVIQDLVLTYDTYGHALTRSVTTTNLDNRYIRSFVVEDGDGTEVTINQANELKFVEATGDGASININWTDTDGGTDGDPYDLSFSVTNTDKGSVAANALRIFKNVASDSGTAVADNNADTLTIAGGTNINTAVVGDTLTINNEYTYTHPTYNGDDFSIDTGPLTGATVISDLDINVTTDSIGSVVDANGTVATRNLTLGDLGFLGWDVEVNGTHVADIGNNDDVDFKNGNHTTAVWTASGNRIQWNHNTFTTGGTFIGGNNNGIVIESLYVDTYGHIRDVQTRDLDSRFDNYNEWRLQDNDDSTTQYGHVDSTEYVKFINGTNTTTARGGTGTAADPHTIRVNVTGAQLTSSPATFFCVQNSGSNNNPKLQLSDQGNVDPVTIVGGTNVTVTRNSNTQLTIAATDTNTDVDVSVANLRTRLGGISDDTTIGDASDVDITFSGDVIVSGDLTVSGTTTTVNTEQILIQDNIITLNSNSPNTPTADAGIEVERGNQTNYSLVWNEGTDRWTFNDPTGSYNIPRSSEYMNNFRVEVDDGGNVNITDNEILGLRGGTAIDTDIVATVSGDSHTIQVKHADINSSVDQLSPVTLDYGDNFDVVVNVDVNGQGHVTGVDKQVLTLPDEYTLPVATSSALGGVKIGAQPNIARHYAIALDSSDRMYVNVPWTDTFRTVSVDTNGDGTVDNTLDATETLVLKKGSNVSLSESGGVVTISASGYTLPAATATARGGIELFSNTVQSVAANTVTTEASRTYGVQVNSAGQAVVNVPWTDTNTNTNQLTTFQVEDGDGTEVTISQGKEWKFVEGSEDVDAVDNNYIQINWSDTSTGSDTDPYDLRFSHKRTTRTNTTNGSATAAFGGTFTMVDGVTTNATGHVTGVNTKTITMPSNPNTDTNRFLLSTATVDNGADMILRYNMTNDGTNVSDAHDLAITAGSGITLTPGTNTFEIKGKVYTASVRDDDDTTSDVTLRLTDESGGTQDIEFAGNSNITFNKHSGGGIEALIASNSIGNAKLADMVEGTIKGRVASGTGNPGDLGPAEVRTLLNVEDGAEVNQNAFSTIEFGTYSGSGEGGTQITAASETDAMDVFFWNDSFTVTPNNTTKKTTVRLKTDQTGQITKVGSSASMYMDLSPNGYIDIYDQSGASDTVEFKFESDGDFKAAGDVVAFATLSASDVKLKENIERVEGALDKVSQLDGVTFNWKKDGKESAGVIAQNVEEVLPSAVKEVEALDGEEINKHVDYTQLSALFIEAIKELKEENKLLRDEIENLKSINS